MTTYTENERMLIAEGLDALRPDDEPEEYDLADQRPAIEAINNARKARGMSFGAMEDRSGISTNSFYHWRDGSRSPALCNLVALAQTFGYEIILRRKDADDGCA